MKKYATILVVIALMFSTACFSNEEPKTGQSLLLLDITEINSDSIDVYVKTHQTTDEPQQMAKNSVAAHFNKNADEYGIDVLTSCQVYADVPLSKSLKIFSRDFNVEYSGSSIATDSLKKSDFNRQLDSYAYIDKNTGDRVEVKYLNETNTVGFVYRFSKDIKGWTQDDKYLHDEELNMIARDFLLSLLPDEELEKYTLIDISLPQKGNSIYYYVTYMRYINGYETDDILSVSISQNKEIVGYNGKNYKKYSSVENLLTLERINAVSTALRDKIDGLNVEYESIYNCKLATDVYGGVYIAMSISYGDMMSQQDCIYANILTN